MQHTLIALVENKPGVLNRVASLVRRRNFNIEALNLKPTEQAGISRLIIEVDSESEGIRNLKNHISKLVNVLEVQEMTAMSA